MYGFKVFILTVLITRISLWMAPVSSPTIGSLRLHHYMYGIAIMLISLFIQHDTVFPIGLGLFIDELGFIMIGGKTHSDNYSLLSLIILVILVLAVYTLRDLLFAAR